MPDRWSVVVDGPDISVHRNGGWYTGVDDIEEGVAIASNQRAKKVVIEHEDGYTETRRL